MCSPQCLNTMFVNLKVIGKLSDGGRLNTSKEVLLIDTGGIFAGAWRWMEGDSREKTLKRVQEILSTCTFCIKNAILRKKNNNNNNNCEFPPQILPMDDSEFLFRIYNDLKNAIKGIESLRDTYHGDATLQARLELIIQDTQNLLEDLKKVNGITESVHNENFKIHEDKNEEF